MRRCQPLLSPESEHNGLGSKLAPPEARSSLPTPTLTRKQLAGMTAEPKNGSGKHSAEQNVRLLLLSVQLTHTLRPPHRVPSQHALGTLQRANRALGSYQEFHVLTSLTWAFTCCSSSSLQTGRWKWRNHRLRVLLEQLIKPIISNPKSKLHFYTFWAH